MQISGIKPYFNETLPRAMHANPDFAKSIGGKFQLIITGEGGGEWYIDASDSGPNCLAGNPGGADCSMTMNVASFLKYFESPQTNGMQLFFAGQLKIAGNQLLFQSFYKLFTL